VRKNNFEFLILNFELNAWQAKDEERVKEKGERIKAQGTKLKTQS